MKKPSGWINFQDYLGVNEDQGQGMADRVAGDVSGVGNAAKAQLGQAQNQLQAQAEAGAKDPAGKKKATTSAEAGANSAAAAYKGPESLDGVDPTLSGKIADASARVAQAGTTSGQAGILRESYGQPGGGGMGGMGLDSFLLSGAGGGQTMQGLQQDFGKLGDQYGAAQQAGASTVAGAKGQAAANQAGWAGLQSKLLGDETAAGEQASKDAAEAEFEKKWQDAQRTETRDEINRAFGNFNSIMSPITQIAENTGNRDPISDWGRKTIDASGGVASGGTRGQKIFWQPQHKEVFRQMDPKQWEEINGLPARAQQGWIAQRMMELKKGLPHSRYDATRGFDTDPHKYL